MTEFYIVGGVIGGGKTSVMNKAKELGAKFEIVNVGNKFLEVAQKYNLNIKRDELRLIKDLELYKRIHKNVIDLIAEIKAKKVILDTRFVLLMEVGYYPGIPTYVSEKLKPKKIILIEAKPLDILKRWARDAARRRGYEFELDIEEYAMMERMYAVSFSEIAHVPIKVIENREDQIERAAKEFIRTIK